MPAFGKVHSAVHTGFDRVKSGLRWAGHKYQQGMHLAGKVNDLYQTGKKIGCIFYARAAAAWLVTAHGQRLWCHGSSARHRHLEAPGRDGSDLRERLRDSKTATEPTDAPALLFVNYKNA